MAGSHPRPIRDATLARAPTPPRPPPRAVHYPATAKRGLPRLFFPWNFICSVAGLHCLVHGGAACGSRNVLPCCPWDAGPTGASSLYRRGRTSRHTTPWRCARRSPPRWWRRGSLLLAKCPSPAQEAGGRGQGVPSPGATCCKVGTWQVCVALQADTELTKPRPL